MVTLGVVAGLGGLLVLKMILCSAFATTYVREGNYLAAALTGVEALVHAIVLTAAILVIITGI